ncbi:hypothetical protein ACMAUO_14290 [Gluconacetobacter sp. Hr-1-5]|uniref:hypothetical protein n=1 Tax=Gluconacetobacter sp. Hr-1-5 TaxID=3395370 RepID=UPI003B521A1C
MRASALRMVLVMAVALPILSACADRGRPLDDDGESYAEDGGSSGRRGRGGMGGGQGLWTEALRTATQVGMGFLRH